jgi:uracil phosphoribosyltransferase
MTTEQQLYTLRHPETGREQFRQRLRQVGIYLGHQLQLDTIKTSVTTVMETEAKHFLPEQLVLVPVLRAGMPLYEGIQRVFPDAESGFIGAMRNEKSLKATISYVALPDVRNKTVVLLDTMLATAGSARDAATEIYNREPKRIIFAGAIAAEAGVHRLQEAHPQLEILIAAIDPHLDNKGYILPGLGDAGDRCYGVKI